MDFLEAVHRDRVYPLVFCHMRLRGRIDLERLTKAVAIACKAVPEAAWAFDFNRCEFVDKGFTAHDIVKQGDRLGSWDLDAAPQLQVRVRVSNDETRVHIGVSHILTDGAGFMQLLDLVASAYNDDLARVPQNSRDIGPLLHGQHVGRRPSKDAVSPRPLRSDSTAEDTCFLAKHQIAEGTFSKAARRAKDAGTTVNDMLMTAYMRAIARLQNAPDVCIPCPADLRRMGGEQENASDSPTKPDGPAKPDGHDERANNVPARLTVANMTGSFQHVKAHIEAGQSFGETLHSVHSEMQELKARKRCLAGIRPYYEAFRFLPKAACRRLAEAAYHPSPTSYTNIGIIDGRRLAFDGCEMLDCFMTGTYRLPPDLQVSASTFKGACTLTCAVQGDASARRTAERLLDATVAELERWAG